MASTTRMQRPATYEDANLILRLFELRREEKGDQATTAPRFTLKPIAIDTSISRDNDPAPFFCQRTHPSEIVDLRLKMVGQMKNLIAFRFQQFV